MAHPPYATRVRDARERAALSPQAAAAAMGLNDNWFWDLEAYDDELPFTVSLRQIKQFCDLVGADPWTLLAPDPARVPTAPPLTPAAVVGHLQAHLAQRGETLESFEEAVGWDLQRIVAEPDRLLDYTPEALQHICAGLGLEWLRAVPR